MADDITLTVRVRDMTRGDFNRLDERLDRMRRELRGVNRDTDSAGMHSRRLGQDIEGLSAKFRRMQETGSLTRRELTQLRGSLDAMSRSALNAARSGEINADSYRNVHGELSRLRAELDRFDAGLNNNTNTINRNNNAHRTTVRMVNGVVQSVRTMTRSVDGNTNVINTFRRDAGRVTGALNDLGDGGSFAGKMFGNMHAKLIGTATVLIASLLPTIGALGPMLAGLGSIVGVAALAFSGLSKPTKQLSKDEKEFLNGLKPLNREFKAWQKTAREAILPKVSKSFGDIQKAMRGLDPVIKTAGNAFGDLVGKIARGVSSKDFMGPFLQNVKMGTKWVEDFAGSFGTFTKSLFDFGTKSKPALDAWQNLLGGFLDRGLPNMFRAMEPGIKGASSWLNGLAYVINDSLLPGLGRMIASFMKTFGPFLEQLLIGAGDAFTNFSKLFEGAMIGLEPVMSVVTDALRAFNAIAKIGSEVFFDLASVLGGALLGTLQDLGVVDLSPLTGGFRGLSDWVKENQSGIRGAFMAIAVGVIDMVSMAVGALPTLTSGFQTMATLILEAVGIIINGLATLPSIPGFKNPFKDAAKHFNEMKGDWEETLNGMSTKAQDFATAAQSNLSKARLKLDVTEAKRNLDDIKEALKDPKLTATQRAKLEVDKANAEGALARAQEALNAFNHKKATARIEGNNAPFFGSKAQADAARMKSHSAAIKATTGGFWASVHGIPQIVGTRFISVQMQYVESHNAPKFSALGGVMRRALGGRAHLAEGGEPSGAVSGPGTSMSDSIPAMLSNGEYVVRASSVRKYGLGFLDAVNSGRLRVAGFKSGGVTKSEKEHISQVTGELTVSRFGVFAGSKNSENITALTKNDTMQPLVDQLNHLRTVIKQTTHGITESKLLKKLDTAGKQLISYQKKLESVNKQLDAAKTKLSDLKEASAQLKDSIKQSSLGEVNITKAAAADDSHVTINTLLSQMQADAANQTGFASLLSQLKAKGVDKGLLQDIANAGVGGGGLETAQALMGASASQLKQLNSLRYQQVSAANSLGATVADSFYAAGIKAAEGLVKGLTAEQSSIEKAMLAISKSMESSIKKALGIHSPSRVMMNLGHQTAEGYAIGVQKNTRVNSAWESMLNVSGTPARSAPAAAGQPMTVQIIMGGRNIGEVVIDPLRKAISHRGGDVQAVLGKG